MAGFVHFRRAITISSTRAAQLFGTRLSPATTSGARSWLPRITDIMDGTISTSPAPTGGQSYDARIRLNTVELATLTLTAGLTDMRGSFNIANLPVGDVGASDAVMNNYVGVPLGGAASQEITVGMSYLCNVADDDINLQATGDDAFNVTLAASNRFLRFWQSNSASVTSEGSAQIPWPIPGSFQYLYIAHGSHGAEDVSFSLRVNGVDVITKTLSATAVLAGVVDNTSVVDVVAGDLVNWRFNRTTGAGVGLAVYACIGFRRTT